MSTVNRSRKLEGCDQGEGSLMLQIVGLKNMIKVYNQAVDNLGSASIDGIHADELKSYFQKHWSEIKTVLLRNVYYPKSVRQLEMLKSNSGYDY